MLFSQAFKGNTSNEVKVIKQRDKLVTETRITPV